MLIMTADDIMEDVSLVMEIIEHFGEDAFLQDLSAQETSNPTRRDASQEEIYHLIMAAGWTTMLPEIFSPRPRSNSKLYQVFSDADDNGYYYYDDPTCDKECKAVEFIYLATAAYLGSRADLFSDELTLKTRSALRKPLPNIVKIFESEAYVYPTKQWPNGRYKHSAKAIRLGER
ncbi:MAG: hypothetical protein R1F54_04085 [Candidatus Zeuxoniibacter abyssi]|nr:MAG: hypothetical protein R1F54_04085 [Candidatus Persebacteraceae bacterium AB1(2)]